MATVVIYNNTLGLKAYTVSGSGSYVNVVGVVTASLGFSGSLHRLADGNPAYIAGPGITLSSSSNGPLIISGVIPGDADWIDNGGNLSTTSSLDVENSASFAGPVTSSLGFSGSLTRLSDGSSYLVEGANITITSQSNGSITIGATTAGSGDNNASYIVVSATGSLTNERVLSGGLGVELDDNGANSTLDINIVDSVVATVSGTTFTGNVLTSGNLEVSGTALIYGETSVGDPGFEQGLITYNSGVFDAQFKVNDISQGRDALTVFHRHSTVDAANIVFARSKTNDATHAPLDPGDLISRHFYVSWASGSGGAGYVPAAFLDAVVDGPTEGGAMPGRFDFSVSPPGVPSPALALRINSTGSIFQNNVHVSGTTTSESGFSGSLTRLTDGSSYLVEGANVTITSQSNGSITISSTGGGGGGSSLWTDEGAAGVSQTGSITVGGNGGFGGYVSASLGFSGSLTRLADGSSYLVAGANVTITSESNGSITIASSGSGGGTCDVYDMWLPDLPPEVSSPYDDEFDGATTGSIWQIWNVPVTTDVYTEDGRLVLEQPTTLGDSWKGIIQPAPSGSFTIYTKIGITSVEANFSTIALVLQDDGINNPTTTNFASWGLTRNINDLILEAINWNAYNAFLSSYDNDVVNQTHMYMRARITSGSETSAGMQLDWSTDGRSWTRLTSNSLGYRPKTIGIAVNNINSGETVLGFADFFRVVDDTDSFAGKTGRQASIITGSCSGGGTTSTLSGSSLWTDEGLAGVSQTGSITVGGDGGFAGYVSASLGFSGSLTRLTDGSSYLVAGANVTITSESNGSITIASSGGGGTADVDWIDNGDEVVTTSSVGIGQSAVGTDAQLAVSGNIALTGTLYFGSGTISLEQDIVDNVSQVRFVGASGTLFTIKDLYSGTLWSVNDISGLELATVQDDGTATFVGPVTSSLGFSGSLTRLTDGTHYITTTNLSIATGSTGQITIDSPIRMFEGFFAPENNYLGSVGDIYFDGFYSRYYFKESGNNTTTGWAEFGPNRICLRSNFNISTSQTNQLLWIPFNGTIDSTSMNFNHMFLMPCDGYIDRVTVMANRALNSSCDVEVHSAPDGSSTFSLIDSDTSMNLSTAYTIAASNSIGVAVSEGDKIAVNFQTATIPATTSVLVTVEILLYNPTGS